VRSNSGRPQRRRYRRHQGSCHSGPGAARRFTGRGRVRATARLRWRVHRRGADLDNRAFPLLRRRRIVDAAYPGARRPGGPPRSRRLWQRVRSRRGARSSL
ncbi:MAG: Sulfur metabolism protein SseC, partial [uncultured Propionibacteriaceae bacterium]